MANRTHFLQCYVHLTDKTAYEAAKAQADLGGGWIIGISPDQAAIDYGAALVIPSPTQRFDPPCITSGYFASTFNYPKNVASFTRKSGGWFGIPLLFGDTHTYRWCFTFTYAGSDDNETEIPGEPAPVAMGARRWVDGFEAAKGGGPNLGGNAHQFFCPTASRHLGGFGFACRNGGGRTVRHSLTEDGVTAVTNRGWDRIYIRLRHAPQTSQDMWKTIGATSPNASGRILINPSRQLEYQNVDSGSTRNAIGTGKTLDLNRWYKLDILYRMGAAPDSFLKVYVNGVLDFTINGGSLPAGTGITQVQNVSFTEVGDGHTSNHRGAWDLDDWIGSPLPAGGANPELFPARDWNAGSKVVGLRAKAAAASNTGNWAGPGGADANDWRFITQRCVVSTSTQFLSSASASQRIAVVTEADRRIDLDPLNRGANGISVGVNARNATAAPQDSLVGFKLPSAAEVTKTPPVISGADITQADGFLTHAGGSIEPVSPMAGSEMSYQCNSSVSTKEVASLIAQVECIGIFHPEDYVPQPGDPAGFTTGLTQWTQTPAHQPYADSPYAVYGQPTPSLVVIHTRTYVGNGTSQQLAFRVPPTWIFVRNTATHTGFWWMCGMPASSHGFDVSTRGSLISRAFIDPNFTEAAEDQQTEQTIVELTGNLAASNASGVTYNLLAWCDPGMRFSEVGALWETAGGDVARDTSFNNSEFTPELFYGYRQITGNATTAGLYSKGAGNALQGVNLLNVAVIAAGLEFATGKLVIAPTSGLYVSAAVQFTFIVFRRDDTSGDANIGKVLQIASWIGDGTASRTIGLAPVTGRRPMWAMVTGSNGVGRQRDASHTSTNSMNMAALSQVTDGITAGAVDSISVGSALNTSTVTFEALVFPGCDAVAVNNGWGGNCEHIPVEPIPPQRPPIVPPVPVPPGGPGPTPPGTTPLTPTGTITQCPTESTIVINMALSRIGISKQLTSTTLNTEVSPEATVARLHYDEDVRAILRDFPWPFATRYEVLTQVAGPAYENDLVQTWVSTVAYPKNSVVRVSGIDYYALGNAAAGTVVTDPAAWSTTPVEEVNGDWLYAYRAPTLMAMARRVVNNTDKTRRMWDTAPPDFRVGSDAVGALIYSNEPNAELEYTVLDNCVARQGDALFRNALAWRHAHALAPALTRDEKITASCWSQYERLLRDARTSAGQEKQDPRESDPDWISGRN